MKKSLLISILLILNAAVYPQIENYKQTVGLKAKYFQDFLSFSGQNGKTRLDVFIKVPYTSVHFVKTGKGFEAGYSVTASIYDEEKEKLITEKIWNENIIAISFEQTVAPNNFNLSHRSFDLSPGKYFIITMLTDKDSKSEFKSENLFDVKDLTRHPSISDLMLVEKRSVVEGSSKIVPNISRDVITEKEGIPLFFEVYTDSAAEYILKYSLTDEEENLIHSVIEKRVFDQVSNQVLFTIDSVSLNIGRFDVRVEIQNTEEEVQNFSVKSFVSRWEGVPPSITDLDKAVDQLIYMANPEELSYIEETENRREKTSRFVDFWKKRDPNPADEFNPIFNEYYNRVAYANENFTTYSMEGWRSDRGMVFIILGIPNNIDRHPFEYYSKPYEVWQYYDLNRSFIFIDYSGFGDYRLSPDTPLYGDLYRFRY